MIRSLERKFGYLRDVIQLLSKSDRKKLFFLGLFQFLISILDLLGLLIIGIVTSLAMNVITLTPIPNNLNFILTIPFLDKLSLEHLIICLALIAASLLMFKTITSALMVKKVTGFLAQQEARISSEYILNVSKTSPRSQLSKSPQYISGVAIEGANSALTLSLGQLINLFVEFLSITLVFLGISSFDPSVTVPSLIFFTVMGLLSIKFLSSYTKAAGKEQFLVGISSNELIKNIVVSSRELYLSDKRDYVVSNYAELRNRNYKAVRTKAMISLIPKYVSEITMILGGIFIASFQFILKDAREAIVGLIVFVALSSRLIPSLLRIQGAILEIRGGSEATKNFLAEFDVVKSEAFRYERLHSNNAEVSECLSTFTPSISLQNVSLKYSKDSNFSIDNLTLRIEPGEFLAVVGPSGSGKTTLIDLMLGIMEPDSGHISISSVVPAKAMKLWPSKVRYVPQDIQLIEGSILQNVIWPNVESVMNPSELQDLFEIVELSSWLQTLEDSWHTKINSLGTNLSGGQKQRIGIARALYSSPSVIFMDESTSALDSQTEREIVNNILLKMKSLTRIVIAHRISTIENADRILYIHSGQIVAEGDFNQIKMQIPDFANEVDPSKSDS